MKPSPRTLLLWLAAALLAAGLAIAYLFVRPFEFDKLRDEYRERTPGELIRYARIRLIGHDLLEPLMLPALAALESSIERAIPQTKLPSLGKGQQGHGLAPVRFADKGQAQAASATPKADDAPFISPNEVRVSNGAELLRAIQEAQAGQTILIAPGRHKVSRTLLTAAAGEADLPITVRAAKPGSVHLEVSSPTGVRVAQPFWVFENLHLRGVCEEPSDCEHAFHIVGAARNTVIRNNLIEDFNSHIRVNGEAQSWPDNGLIQFNTLGNSRPRATHRVVAPIDIVGANRWRVLDNHISGFSKSLGNKNAYGGLMRGGGHGGRFERNVLLCKTQSGAAIPGIQVGLSFGGSSTDKRFCREACEVEHQAGLAVNNVIAHCNDFGLDVNQSRSILLAHNSLINTAGVDVRSAQSTAKVYGNLLDGRVRQRDGAQANASMNEAQDLRLYLENPDGLALTWRGHAPRLDTVPTLPMVAEDFCGRPRGASSLPGVLAEPGASCIAARAAAGVAAALN